MLAGSTVLVTGCSRGLGLEMTRQLLTRSVPLKLLLRSFGHLLSLCSPPLPEELGKWWQPVDNLTMLRNLENLLSSILKPSLLQGLTSINCEMCEILFNRLDVTDLDSFTVFSETVWLQSKYWNIIFCWKSHFDTRLEESVELKESTFCWTMQELPRSQPGLTWWQNTDQLTVNLDQSGWKLVQLEQHCSFHSYFHSGHWRTDDHHILD